MVCARDGANAINANAINKKSKEKIVEGGVCNEKPPEKWDNLNAPGENVDLLDYTCRAIRGQYAPP